MKAVFVDTAGWVSCADGADAHHARSCAARDAALEAGQTFVTTDVVVDATLTLIRLRFGLAAAERWWQQIDRSPRLRWERVESDRFEKARLLFFQGRLVPEQRLYFLLHGFIAPARVVQESGALLRRALQCPVIEV